MVGLDRAAPTVTGQKFNHRFGLCRDMAPGMAWHYHQLDLYQNIASAVGERHLHLGLGEHHFWVSASSPYGSPG